MRAEAPMTSVQSVLVSLLTPPGRGALAVVGVSGTEAAAIVDRAFAPRGARPVAGRDDGAIAFGSWRATGEELVVVRRRANLVEVHCHGGLAAAAAVITSLVALGAEEVAWPRWLAAAGESQTVVEAHEALAVAGGPKAARILARQAAGALDAEMERIERRREAGDHAAADAAARRLLRAARVGLRLTRPWRVVLTGPVNAGKSSLVNALAGYSRSIVSPEPGTTRDLVEVRLVLGGWEVDLFDTAGLRRGGAAAGLIEQAGIGRAVAATEDADLVLQIVPADATPPSVATDDALLVLSKTDLAPIGHTWPADAVLTSAATGAGIADLAAVIVARLVPEERTAPDLLTGPVPFTQRHVDMLAGHPVQSKPAHAAHTDST